MSGIRSIFYSIVSPLPPTSPLHKHKCDHSQTKILIVWEISGLKILITQLRLVFPKVQQSGLIRILNPHTYHNCCVFLLLLSPSFLSFPLCHTPTNTNTNTLFVPCHPFCVTHVQHTSTPRDRMQFCHAFMNRAGEKSSSSSTEGKKWCAEYPLGEYLCDW